MLMKTTEIVEKTGMFQKTRELFAVRGPFLVLGQLVDPGVGT